MTTTLLPRRAATALPRGEVMHAISQPPTAPTALAAPLAPLVVALDGRSEDPDVLHAARLAAGRIGAPHLVVVAAARDHHAAEAAARALARTAQRHRASLLVMGASRHAAIDQLFGRETTLYVLREADRPVLVVAPGLGELPRRAVVAVDFTAASARAARHALALVADGGTLTLAHVMPRALTRLARAARVPGASAAAPDAASRRPRGCRVAELLDEVAGGLEREIASGRGAAHGVRVEPVVLSGDPATEILAHAAAAGADLVAAGLSGARSRQRMFVGSVATSILRRAACSVLVSPH